MGELDLVRHGLKLLKPIASSFTPCLDRRYLLLGLNDEHDHLALFKFSKVDADAYPRSDQDLPGKPEDSPCLHSEYLNTAEPELAEAEGFLQSSTTKTLYSLATHRASMVGMKLASK
ncbi:hypothetical protein TorRG33x02_292640 [Trema orientale]|uniref:Uncharacterized protein n=1 Tax=Trema orientale TaxID=63057 RepID=A0A2P5C9Q5_TREOI|nr:hypothetical protein TorRG33x02_292640 [Trema orientale]